MTPPSRAAAEACVFCLEASCSSKEPQGKEGFVNRIFSLLGVTSVLQSHSPTKNSKKLRSSDDDARTCDLDLFDLTFPISPFCLACLDAALELLTLQEKLEEIQFQVQLVKEKLKNVVKKSLKIEDRKDQGLPPSYFHIRQRLLESDRKISTKRLANISGIPVEHQEGSELSSDDLSQSEEPEASSQSQSGNDVQSLEPPDKKVFKQEVKVIVKKQELKDEVASTQDAQDDSDRETGFGLDLDQLKGVNVRATSRTLRSRLTSLSLPDNDNSNSSSEVTEDEGFSAPDSKRRKFEIEEEQFEDTEMCFEVNQPKAGRVLRNLKWKEEEEKAWYGGVPVEVNHEEGVYRCRATGCDFETTKKGKKHPLLAVQYHIKTKHYLAKKNCSCPNPDPELATTPHICPSRPRKLEKNCKSCGSIFPNQSLLKSHDCPEKNETKEKLRSKKKEFVCSICQKSLSSKRALENHEQTHQKSVEERRTSQCYVCGQKFTPTELTPHLRKKHRIGTELQEWKCKHPGCDKSFPHQSKLKRHQATHCNGTSN